MPEVNTSTALIKLMKTKPTPADIAILLQEGIKANHASQYTQSLRFLKKLYPVFEDTNGMDTEKAYCAYYMGLNFKAINEYDQAYFYLRTAAALASAQNGLVGLRQVAQLYMGICEEALGQYQSAIVHLNELAEQTDKNSDHENNILHFRARLHTYRCMIMLGQNNVANTHLKEMESNYQPPVGTNANQTREINELHALMYQLLGISQIFARNFEDAKDVLDNANLLYKLINGSEKHTATIAQYLGVAHANLNASSKSTACLSNALRYFRATGDAASQYFIYLALAINYSNQKNTKSARENLGLAMDVLVKCRGESNRIALELHSSTQYFLPQLISVEACQEFEKLRVSIINTIDSLGIDSKNSKASSSDSHSSSSPRSASYTFLNKYSLSSDSDEDEPGSEISETELKPEQDEPKLEMRY